MGERGRVARLARGVGSPGDLAAGDRLLSGSSPMQEIDLERAHYRNTRIKRHGLGEICHRPMPFPVPMRVQNILPFMTMAYDAFGASRMMWGSDFPSVAGREGYRNTLQWTMEHIPFRSEGDRNRSSARPLYLRPDLWARGI
jgi:predicted TIM-barrel fold metal-dependent hydrolase